MSLVATLLLNQPVTLPAGRARFHYMDKTHKSVSALPPKPGPTPTAIRRKNVETVFLAIAAGASSVNQLVEATGISNSKVNGIMHELLAEKPPRITGGIQGSGWSRKWKFEAIQ